MSGMSGKAIRETLAALGVIASMVFVGLEIRQSNVQARAAAYQAIGIAAAEVHDNWAHDRQFVVSTLGKEAAAMDAIDWLQWSRKVTVFARLGEMVLSQVDQGLLPEDAMEQFGFSGWGDLFQPLAPNYGGPKYACVWPLIRREVSESFRVFVEEGQDMSAIDCSGFAIPPIL